MTDDGDGDEVLRSALRADTYDAVNLGAGLSGQPGLPIYVVSGDDDPLAGRGALVDLVADRYQQAGVRDVTVARYAGARHEVFNETNLDQITADLIAWLDRVTSRWFARSAGPRGSVVVR
ncbi:MAG: alpha/beta hydrolase [Ilumatobacteraceae bacterium]